MDARDLLGRLLQSNMSGSANDRIAHGMGPNGVGGTGSPLGDLLGGLLGGSSAGQGQGGGLGGGLGGLLSQLGGGSAGGAQGGGLGGGLGGLASQAETMLRGAGGKDALAMGGLASLAGAVLGGRRGGAGGALGGGLLAFLGSLAFSALKNRDAAASPTSQTQLPREVPLGLREPQTPAEEQELENTALLAIRAMIDAAKADGAIDGNEMGRIVGKLKELGTDDSARDFVMNELQKPLNMDDLVSRVRSPEVAVQVYSASLLAIDVDTPAEKEYLQKLAQALQLDAETVARVHEALGIAAA
ncbi:MAG: tellurite resistance TerB family protein [Rhodospirillales bacterium]|nr:tellurite resistance TerB family protein [Rhodospirillales bacterium]